MEQNQFFMRVSFRDANKNRINVDISIRNNGTLLMQGEAGWGCGQIYDDILPNNESQRELCDLWRGYHFEKVDPDEMKSRIERIVAGIIEGEKDRVNSKDLGLYSKDGAYTEEDVRTIEDTRKVDEIEARNILCLMAELDMSYNDLVDTLTGGYGEYSVEGIDYLVGTDEHLKKTAIDYLVGDDSLWRESVQAGQTVLGLQDWAERIVDIDGYASVLNGFDGRSDEHLIGNEWIGICRI